MVYSWLGWLLAGVLWCITIVGIPVGLQCFKFAKLAFFPFGKEIVYGGGVPSFLLNVIWLIVSGFLAGIGIGYFWLSIVYNHYWNSVWITAF